MSRGDGELTSAVRQATDDLDGYTFQADDSGPLSFTDYESLIENKVTEYGGGAPEYGVTVEPADGNTDDSAPFTVTAKGAATAFCAYVE